MTRYPPVEQRFWAKVDKTEGCWNWTGVKVTGGYGLFRDGPGAKKLAHRWVWENTAGPIPDGYQVDHLCKNPSCVNPTHLEPVPPRTNWERSGAVTRVNALKTHCKRDHEFTPANTYRNTQGNRGCRQCKKEYQRERYLRSIA